MRIWSILLIKSDSKWCIHLSRSLCLNQWTQAPTIYVDSILASRATISKLYLVNASSSTCIPVLSQIFLKEMVRKYFKSNLKYKCNEQAFVVDVIHALIVALIIDNINLTSSHLYHSYTYFIWIVSKIRTFILFQEMYCSAPPSVEHATVTPGCFFAINEQATYTCGDSYAIQDSYSTTSTVTCQKDLTWTQEPWCACKYGK